MEPRIRRQILVIRDTGRTNMFDVNMVQHIAYEMGYYELVCWLEDYDASVKKLHAVEVPPQSVMDGFNDWLGRLVGGHPCYWYVFTHRRFRSSDGDIYRTK